MRHAAAPHRPGVVRRRFERVRVFVVKERSVGVLIILLLILALGGVALRVFFFHDWLLWFWAMTAFTALELLATAVWDLVVDLRGGTVYLVTDRPAPWTPWVQRALVPALLVVGILVDHFLVH